MLKTLGLFLIGALAGVILMATVDFIGQPRWVDVKSGIIQNGWRGKYFATLEVAQGWRVSRTSMRRAPAQPPNGRGASNLKPM